MWAEIVGWYVGLVNNSFTAYLLWLPIPHLVIKYSIQIGMKVYMCCLHIYMLSTYFKVLHIT